MPDSDSTPKLDRQLPLAGEVFLDHVGHFVRDREAAASALVRAGFSPTPVSIQYNLDGSPMGTGNITAMLGNGYIEVLFKAADTPLGREFDATLDAYPGVHLANVAVSDAEQAHRRLTDLGFAMRPLVQFRRPVDTESGPDFAAFTVVRLERGAMAEGRIQILTHRTEHTVWQKRWLKHRNGALALIDLVVASPDVAEASARFARFADRPARSTWFGQAIVLERGQVQLFEAGAFTSMFPELAVPRLPFIGAYAVRVASLAVLEGLLDDAQLSARRIGPSLVVPFPADLGLGAWVFVERDSELPWRS